MTIRWTKRPDRYIETTIDDETVLMDLDSGNFFSLTDTAAALWRLIDGARDGDAIIAAASAEYNCEAAAIAGDVRAFLDQMAEAGFIAGA